MTQTVASSRPRAARTGARIEGVDVARGLAVLGMFVAHLGTGHHPAGDGWGSQWMWVVDGRSSALFAMLAGVGLAFITRSVVPGDAVAMRRARVKIVVRSGIILVLGWALMLLGTPVAVILPTYAFLFVMALPFLRLRPPALLAVAAAVLVVGSPLVLGLRESLTGTVEPTQPTLVVGELLTGYYPALVWIAYLLVGLAVGRLGLGRLATQWWFVGAGAALAVVAYGLGVVLADVTGADTTSWPGVLVSTEPHSSSMFEMAGNIGVAVAVLGLCLLATRGVVGAVALRPIAATGAMSLTVYTIQIVAIAIVGSDAVWYPTSNGPLLVIGLGCIVFALVWQLTLGRGPLERLLKVAADAATRERTPPVYPPGTRP
ncbi:heparan-alpha-glucosaminide N-acetyltransferase domain-containing protein [Beutenbergia cavernae]|uniref:heparan-alpha-glucosaminide N-acetyltransferase domain-containing protein n=1 Tax=Beutenbergia cavernae TaxID=84757 RepID=UPI00019AD1D7|nr:heparan-alpha-glucosaminide N-acetyltransferase domain-containing protein [Beutenbergia cavernae]